MDEQTPNFLNKIGQLIESISVLNTSTEIYARIAEFVPQCLPADHVTISEYCEESSHIVLHTLFGKPSPELQIEQGQTLPSFATYQEYADHVSVPLIYCPADRTERSINVMLHDAGIVSVLIVPLFSGDRVLGTINVTSKTHHYGEQDTARLEQLSTVLANSITHTESFRSNEAIARHHLYAQHLENMNTLSEVLLRCDSTDDALEHITTHATTLVNAKRITLCKLEADPEYVKIVGLEGSSTDRRGMRIRLADTGLEESLIEGNEMFTTDIENSTIKAQRSLGVSGFKHIWSFPIVSQDEFKRCLNISSKGTDLHIQDATSALKTMVRLFNSTVERISAQRKTLIQATTDSLTGLCNRMEFNRQLESAISSTRAIDTTYLLYLDLDLFKNVNDTLGHSVGDQVLVEVALRISVLLSEHDTLGRIGGDEFMILLTQRRHVQEVEKLAQNVIDSIANSTGLTDQNISIGASIGVCQYPTHGDSAEQLVKNADIAMYKAKELGRNQFFLFTQQLSDTVSRKIQLQKDLIIAIKENQFSLVYQPQYNINSLRADWAEVLLRWEHPTLGWIRPDIFIPIAENCGMISAVSDWVLKNALHELKRIQESNDTFCFAINISAVEFSPQHQLPNRLNRAIEEAGVHSTSLEIEITETAFLQHPEHASKLADELTDAGIRIAIDDFGTGYGSLTYLVQLPISCIKVDRSFVEGVEKDKKKQAIVKGIVAISNGLNISCLAEGVETEQELAWLKNAGCHTAQGFLLSKPVGPVELRHIITSQGRIRSDAA